MNNKSVSAATIGYTGFALSLWVEGVFNSGWLRAPPPPPATGAVVLPLAVLLLVVGILGFMNDRVLDTVIFLGGAALWWSHHTLQTVGIAPHGAGSLAFFGWFFIIWAAFFAWVFVAALKANLWRTLFLLGMWLWLLALAIHDWYPINVLRLIAGYITLATAVLAGIVSASEIYRHSSHLMEENGAAGFPSGRGR